MCGIAGIIRWDGRPGVEQDIRAMCRMMVHRGPDEEGFHFEESVGLGHRRLSIIDLAAGQQPLCNEDGTVNGEHMTPLVPWCGRPTGTTVILERRRVVGIWHR